MWTRHFRTPVLHSTHCPRVTPLLESDQKAWASAIGPPHAFSRQWGFAPSAHGRTQFRRERKWPLLLSLLHKPHLDRPAYPVITSHECTLLQEHEGHVHAGSCDDLIGALRFLHILIIPLQKESMSATISTPDIAKCNCPTHPPDCMRSICSTRLRSIRLATHAAWNLFPISVIGTCMLDMPSI